MTERRLTRRDFHAAALCAAVVARLSHDPRAGAQISGRPNFAPGAALGERRIFPADDTWNREITREAVDPHSMAILYRVGLDKPLHPDFGTVYNGNPNGIPYNVVPGDQPRVPVKFGYPDESDPGPYPIPPGALIEGGPRSEGDRHVLVVDRDNWKLYELFNARPEPGGRGWSASSGAVFDLSTNTKRPAGWTSADAAGLPIFPGLVRYEEVVRGAVRHALRFTVVKSRRGYVVPARHFASPNTNPDLPPMGMRVRLKANYDTRKFPAPARVILETLKTHGMFLADNGGDWFLGGAPDPRWDDEELATLKRVNVRDFEVIRLGEVVTR